VAVDAAGGLDLRQHAEGDVQLGQDLGVPAQVLDVEQHGAGGVGIVGDVHLAAGEVPDQPGVDVAEQQFALLGPLPGAFDVVEDPLDLGAGEVGVHHQAGVLLDVALESPRLQVVADGGRAPALPDDGVVDRLAGGLVPDDGGFPLVGDADGGHFLGADAHGLKNLAGHAHLAAPDFHGVMLDPAGLGVDLGEFLLGHADALARLVEQDGAGTGGALVQGENIFLSHDQFSLVGLVAVVEFS
jgi:hypothetical protein